MNKKFLRKVLERVFWLLIIYIGILFLLFTGLNIFVKPCFIIAYTILVVALKGWIIPKCIIAKAIRKRNKSFNKAYHSYKKAFKKIQGLHKCRYKLYFSSGDINEINMLTNAINENGKILIDTGNNFIAKAQLDGSQRELIQYIIDETTLLIENESVNSNVTKSPT